jgi:hypothetical protein
MKKILIIDTCYQCQFGCEESDCDCAGGTANFCHKESRVIPDMDNIPEWCRLDTYITRSLPMTDIDRLKECNRELVRALEGLVDDEPCRYDHHGYCQTHRLNNPCEMQVARAALKKAGGGEG